jgi:hypothetical protein
MSAAICGAVAAAFFIIKNETDLSFSTSGFVPFRERKTLEVTKIYDWEIKDAIKQLEEEGLI